MFTQGTLMETEPILSALYVNINDQTRKSDDAIPTLVARGRLRNIHSELKKSKAVLLDFNSTDLSFAFIMLLRWSKQIQLSRMKLPFASRLKRGAR
jgi:hypothetical protein